MNSTPGSLLFKLLCAHGFNSVEYLEGIEISDSQTLIYHEKLSLILRQKSYLIALVSWHRSPCLIPPTYCT